MSPAKLVGLKTEITNAYYQNKSMNNMFHHRGNTKSHLGLSKQFNATETIIIFPAKFSFLSDNIAFHWSNTIVRVKSLKCVSY